MTVRRDVFLSLVSRVFVDRGRSRAMVRSTLDGEDVAIRRGLHRAAVSRVYGRRAIATRARGVETREELFLTRSSPRDGSNWGWGTRGR